MRRTLLIALAALLAILAAGVGLYHWASLPTTLRVAVGPVGSEDTRLVVAAAQYLARERADIRLKIVLTDGAAGSAAAIDEDRAQLAVVRTDIAMPERGQTVAVMHRDAALLMAMEGGGVAQIADLRGRRVGVVRSHQANQRLLGLILDHFEIPRESVRIEPLEGPDQVREAFQAGRIDAVLAVGTLTGRTMTETVAAVTQVGGAPPVFLPVLEAEAIAQRLPTIETHEVVRGAFGGLPPRPGDNLKTLGVSHRLVAHADVDDANVSEFTRLLFVMRPQLATQAPIANRIEEPDTSKGSSLPLHPGATAYYEGETLSFMERWGDWFYLFVMVAGIGGSAAAGLFGTVMNRTRNQTMALLTNLLGIVQAARGAHDAARLDALEREADEILVCALSNAGQGVLDETGLVAFHLGLDQARRAIEERRRWLEDRPPPLAQAAE